MNSVKKSIYSFKYNRNMTLDLINSLSREELEFTPNKNQGPLWKQFRHMGRVNENYINALSTGSMNFSTSDGTYAKEISVVSLKEYLNKLFINTEKALLSLPSNSVINWYGETVTLNQHIQRLNEHELIHHGQWIVYFNMLNKKFPDSWKNWNLN